MKKLVKVSRVVKTCDQFDLAEKKVKIRIPDFSLPEIV